LAASASFFALIDGLGIVTYKLRVIEVRQTAAFSVWLGGLRDANAQLRIATRIRRLEEGNAGDAKSVGEGVSEMRIDYGPGYRLYFTQQGRTLVILLCGGDKRTQPADIAKAKQMAKEL
jgi:putative addiction module killer protein